MKRSVEVSLDTFQLIWALWNVGDQGEDDILKRNLKDVLQKKLLILEDPTVNEEIVTVSSEDHSEYAISKIRWVDDVVSALRQLGGEANLSDIYYTVGKLRKDSNREVVESIEATIRQAIEAHSSDSRSFQRRANLFKHVGRGRWRLRGWHE